MGRKRIVFEEGQRFARLQVIRYAGIDKNAQHSWLCRCDCGQEKIICTRSLKSGATRSCGCLQKENWIKVTSERKIALKHGHSYKYWYKSYKSMMARCYRSTEINYPNYGGRGITVCDRWKVSPDNFYEDMGERPEGTSIDRIDVDGNYCPENCRWATLEMQNCNKRKSGLAEKIK